MITTMTIITPNGEKYQAHIDPDDRDYDIQHNHPAFELAVFRMADFGSRYPMWAVRYFHKSSGMVHDQQVEIGPRDDKIEIDFEKQTKAVERDAKLEVIFLDKLTHLVAEEVISLEQLKKIQKLRKGTYADQNLADKIVEQQFSKKFVYDRGKIVELMQNG